MINNTREQCRKDLAECQSALKIIHTWASVPGALDAGHVKALCNKALNYSSQRTAPYVEQSLIDLIERAEQCKYDLEVMINRARKA